MFSKPLSSFSGTSFSGTRGQLSGNQDSCLEFITDCLHRIAIICDGHSDPGGRISLYCTEKFAEWAKQMDLQLARISESDLRTSLNTLFTECHKGVCDMLKAQRKLIGGTTATLVLAIKREDDSYWVVCANVGDSPAYLSVDGNKFISIYEPHSASSMSEFIRMQKACPPPATPAKACYGTQMEEKFSVFMPDGSLDHSALKDPKFNGKPKNVRLELDTRLLHPDEIRTLAITRAIGDILFSPHGVSCIPDISITKVPAGKQFMVCTYSDGIDDVCGDGRNMCNPNTIISDMARGMPFTDAVQKFFSKACDTSIAVFRDSYDDCTIAAFNVNSEKPASAAAMADSHEEPKSAAVMADSHEEPTGAAVMANSHEEPTGDAMLDSNT